nr:MFS transporter [Angustibacter aerolatus]
MSEAPATTAEGAEPAARRREQRAWYFYDWANSAYVTTVATVLLGPYLTSVANRAACPGVDADDCTRDLHVLGLPISPGSLFFYTTTFATILSALVLPVVGAAADRSGRKRVLLGAFAWAGAAATCLLWFLDGTAWGLGVAVVVVAALCLGGSLVVYDALLIEIATPEERDRVSSRGWALGYLGGFLLLAVNLAVVTLHDSLGLTQSQAVRLSLLSAGVWWGAFTLVPVLGLRDRPPVNLVATSGPAVREAFVQAAGHPARAFAATRRRSGSCSPTCSSTTASRPSSRRPASTAASRLDLGTTQAHRHDPAGAGRGVRRCAGVRPAGRAVRRPRRRAGRARAVAGGHRHRVLPAGPAVRPVARAGGAHRRRARGHPGAVAVDVQPPRAPGPRGGVLLAVPGLRARHEPGSARWCSGSCTTTDSLPTGHPGAGGVLRGRRAAAAHGRRARRHRAGRQPGTRACCSRPPARREVPHPAHLLHTRAEQEASTHALDPKTDVLGPSKGSGHHG